MSKRTYKAYNLRGELQLSTWAVGSAQHMEESVYQSRLNKGHFSRVDVSSSDPEDKNFTMYPKASA